MSNTNIVSQILGGPSVGGPVIYRLPRLLVNPALVFVLLFGQPNKGE